VIDYAESDKVVRLKPNFYYPVINDKIILNGFLYLLSFLKDSIYFHPFIFSIKKDSKNVVGSIVFKLSHLTLTLVQSGFDYHEYPMDSQLVKIIVLSMSLKNVQLNLIGNNPYGDYATPSIDYVLDGNTSMCYIIFKNKYTGIT